MDFKKPNNEEDDSYLKPGMKDESEKKHRLAVLKAKAKMNKSKSDKRVNYPFGSVRAGDPFVKNYSNFLKKQDKINKRFGGK